MLTFQGTPAEERNLEEVIMMKRIHSNDAAVYNHAASAYNHTFMYPHLSDHVDTLRNL